MEFEGRGRAREQRRHQTAVERQLKNTLTAILAATGERRQWESVNRGAGGVGLEDLESGDDR